MIPAPGSPPDDGTPPSREGEHGGPRERAGAGAPCGLSGILQASPEPALVATTDGAVVSVNDAFVSTWGLDGNRRIEEGCLSALFSSGAEELLERAGSPAPSSFDGRALLPGGAELELRVSVRRLREPESLEERLVVFASDVTAERRLERAAAVLGAALDAGPADGFFDRLVAGLADTLRMETVLVGRLEPGEPFRVRTLAVRKGGGPGAPFTYALQGAPCERVVGRVPCVFPAGVADLFPKDRVLAERGYSSYVGVPLGGTDGRPLGLLAALSRRPLADGDSACRALGLFAARAAAEIERREARVDEQRREEESRSLVSSIPVGLHHYRLEAGGRLVFTGANPAADAILGVDNSQFLGLTLEEAFRVSPGRPFPGPTAGPRRTASRGEARRSSTPTAASRGPSSSRSSRQRPARWPWRSSTSRPEGAPRTCCANAKRASRGSTGS